jgi:hypothetical protein
MPTGASGQFRISVFETTKLVSIRQRLGISLYPVTALSGVSISRYYTRDIDVWTAMLVTYFRVSALRWFVKVVIEPPACVRNIEMADTLIESISMGF